MALLKNITKRGRFVFLELDNYGKLKIHYEVYLKNIIYRGDDISDEKLELLKKEEELYSAKETALRILSRRIHSENEIRLKLRQREFSESVIDEAVNYLFEKKFLDDYQFAERYIEEFFRRKKAGINKIINGLKKKGISKKIIDELTAELNETGDVLDNARSLAEKKLNVLLKKGKDDRVKIKQKIYSYLVSKGYSFETARNIVESLSKKMDEPII